MRKIVSIFLTVSLVFIASCSKSYNDLSNITSIPSDDFNRYVLEFYSEKADFEAKKMHDWNSAKLYSEKAIKALKGSRIKPEKISYWNIQEINKKELNLSYKNLMTIYDFALTEDPYNLAKAISSLDCWAEQEEEGWQEWDIESCKNDFLIAIQEIYKLYENKSKNDKTIDENVSNNKNSVTVVTKNEKKEILQIVYFDFDKFSLSEVSINKVKIFINQNIDTIENYLIVGHADTKGTDIYNYNLSLERAITVKKLLIDLGIEEQKIKILAKGEKVLLVQTEDNIAHPANRRVEISPIN